MSPTGEIALLSFVSGAVFGLWLAFLIMRPR